MIRRGFATAVACAVPVLLTLVLNGCDTTQISEAGAIETTEPSAIETTEPSAFETTEPSAFETTGPSAIETTESSSAIETTEPGAILLHVFFLSKFFFDLFDVRMHPLLLKLAYARCLSIRHYHTSQWLSLNHSAIHFRRWRIHLRQPIHLRRPIHHAQHCLAPVRCFGCSVLDTGKTGMHENAWACGVWMGWTDYCSFCSPQVEGLAGCKSHLPTIFISTYFNYFLGRVGVPQIPKKASPHQATFGPTHSSLAELKGKDSYEAWILEQMELDARPECPACFKCC